MASYRVLTPSTALVRVEPLACPTRAQPKRMVAEVLSVQTYIYSGNSLYNSPTRAMLSQWKKHRNKLIHLTNVFIYNGGSTQEAELSDYRDASMHSKEHLNNSYLQMGPPTDTHTHTHTQIPRRTWTCPPRVVRLTWANQASVEMR